MRDLNVTLLLLPRFGLPGWDAGGQRFEPLMSVLNLTVDETDMRSERGKLAASSVSAEAGGLNQFSPAGA
jgi:hypothetical protein